MKRFLSNFFINFGIILSLITVFTLLFTGTFVFASEPKTVLNKSYYVEKKQADNYTEKYLELSNKLSRKIETSKASYEYSLKIVDGNVIATNLNTNKKETVYKKGNAKYLSSINYYYNCEYTVIITEDGTLYANVYSNSQDAMKFRKIKTDNKISKIMVHETVKRFYDYPIVEVFGVDEKGNWESIKL